jgi:hypothetical protein
MRHQVFLRRGAADEMGDLVINAGAPDVLFDQSGVPGIILDQHDGHGKHQAASFCVLVSASGRLNRKIVPWPNVESSLIVPPSR